MFTYLLPHTPSLTSRMVSVKGEHRVYLLTSPHPVPDKPYGFCGRNAPCLLTSPYPVPDKPYGFYGRKAPRLLTSLPSPSLTSRIASVDVEPRVYLLPHIPSLTSLMVSVDDEHHVFLLKSCESLRVWHSCVESGGGSCTKAINNINNNSSERVFPGCHKTFVRLVTGTAGSPW